jgi:hypothetical protein
MWLGVRRHRVGRDRPDLFGPLVGLLGATRSARQTLIYLSQLFNCARHVARPGGPATTGLRTRTPLFVAVGPPLNCAESWLIFGLGFSIGASALSTY